MPGTTLRLLLALAAALALGGCGLGDDEATVPDENSEALLDRLQAVEDNVTAGNCATAVDQAEDFVAEVNLLPADVDDELKQGLQEGGARLVELARDDSQCGDTEATVSPEVTETENPEAAETTTTDTTTDTTTTDTEADTATEDAPPAEETEPPADEGLTPPNGDQSDGDDGGGGQSGTLDDTGGIGEGDG